MKKSAPQFMLFPEPSAQDTDTPTWRKLWGGHDLSSSIGAIYTRPSVVELMLDLAGYTGTPTKRLRSLRALEPAAGEGAFFLPMLDRLIRSEELITGAKESIDWEEKEWESALSAFDLSPISVKKLRASVEQKLAKAGCPAHRAASLSLTWVKQADTLLISTDRDKGGVGSLALSYDYIIGNPPYVRIEDLPAPVLAAYRTRYPVMVGRSDLYIAFFELALRQLSSNGVLCFITANRFAKNQYGRALRKIIAEEYHVRLYLDLEHTRPFVEDVAAYPAITILDRDRARPTLAGRLESLEEEALRRVRAEVNDESREAEGSPDEPSLLHSFPSWYPAGEPWSTTDASAHRHLIQLSSRLPTLEESAADTTVGIGVATGADAILIRRGKWEQIEDSRQMPLIMAGDLGNTALSWSGHYLLNPFAEESGDQGQNGPLVDLARYPGLAAYLHTHESRLRSRHVAKKNPQQWYRTIDRVSTSLQSRPKLLIPDIKGSSVIAFDKGDYYPHHNVYYVLSESWDLQALKAILRSRFIFQQVQTHSVALRGGYPRFQAQTLRRLRLPRASDFSASQLRELAQLANTADSKAVDALLDPILLALGIDLLT